MSENVPPDPEKNRRSRSFGSFVLVLLVLLVVLAVVGNDRFQPVDELTQDLYAWHLNKGDVIEQKYRGTNQGTNLIEGTYQKPGAGPTKFKVSYASLDEFQEQFRELKSIRRYVQIAPQTLLEGIIEGIYAPIEARSLTGHRALEERRSEAGDAEAEPVLTRPQAEMQSEERLFVKAIAKGRRARGGLHGEIELPDRSGHVFFDVQLGNEDDLASVLLALRTAGAEVHEKTFDLSGGTSWQDTDSFFSQILIYMAPWVLLIFVFLIFMRQMRSQGGAGGVMSFGRSRAKLYSKESHTNVTFDDVAGAEEAKAEVKELVEFLKNPSRFSRVGGRIPRGVLLVGAPGCGKTLLAKAIAGEAEVPFFSISGSDFVEMFVGVGASRVRDLFKQARENSPCIIFLDEIDAVGRRRGSGMGGGHDEREQTLNAILVEMDGFGTDEGIIVVAATNRPDVLDPALLRPGRFDREVMIDLPDLEGRLAILEVHVKRVKVRDDIELQVLARSTPGYSGADLAAIINEAAIMAVLDKRDEVSMEDLEESRDKVRYGRQKTSRKIEEADRRITAFHEAGHAMVSVALPDTDPPHKVTIVPRGRALGATMLLPEKESYHTQKKRLVAQLAMLFGGRVAESIFCNDVSAGAHDDIRKATDLARTMVTELGMSDKIGPINYAERQGSDFLGTELMRSRLHSEETAREIDEEVMLILRRAYEEAERILQEHRAETQMLGEALLRFETLSGQEVAKILDGVPLDELRPKEPSGDDRPSPRPLQAPGDERAADADATQELPGSPGLSPA